MKRHVLISEKLCKVPCRCCSYGAAGHAKSSLRTNALATNHFPYKYDHASVFTHRVTIMRATYELRVHFLLPLLALAAQLLHALHLLVQLRQLKGQFSQPISAPRLITTVAITHLLELKVGLISARRLEQILLHAARQRYPQRVAALLSLGLLELLGRRALHFLHELRWLINKPATRLLIGTC